LYGVYAYRIGARGTRGVIETICVICDLCLAAALLVGQRAGPHLALLAAGIPAAGSLLSFLLLIVLVVHVVIVIVF
jgi:hypothetical protein